MAKRKRPHGSGALRRRSDGLWELTITISGVFDENGKSMKKTFYARTQAEVLRKAVEFKKNLQNGVLDNRDYTVAGWGEQFLPHHAEFAKLAESTQDSNRYTLKLINRYLGHKRLRDLKTYDVESMLMDLQNDGYGSSTISKVRGLLFQMCQAAAANDIVTKNVVAYAAKTRHVKATPKACFSAEEVKKLMHDLPYNREGLSCRLLVVSGLRAQELLALGPDKIATDGSYVIVEQAVSRKKGSAYISKTKTPSSVRIVPIPEQARKYAIMLRDSCTGVLIWESPRRPGQPINPSTFTKLYYATLEQAGVRKLSPHSCRHTYVSQLQARGVPMEIIRALCGHVDVDMTQHYLHVQEAVMADAVDQLNDIC